MMEIIGETDMAGSLIKAAVLAVVLTTLPFRVLAGETTFRMGTGVYRSEKSAIYAIGYQDFFDRTPYLYKLEAGTWTDDQPGRKGSPYGSTQLGLRGGDLEGFNVQLNAGISFIGYTDRFLGSNFEFTEDLSVGFRNVAFGYKHFSNAGTAEPNLGRDYCVMTITLPF